MTAHQIIKCWPSIADFAADIGVSYKAARMMAYRNRIAVTHWDALVEAARNRGLDGVDHAALLQAYARKAA